jgi:hypothetical protein
MKLSERQRKALALLDDGWTACWSGGLGAGAFIQKGKIGYGGESRTLHALTLHALTQKKLVQRYGGGIGSTHYKISQAGRDALRKEA